VGLRLSSSRQSRYWYVILALALALPLLPLPSYVFRIGALIFIYASVLSGLNLLVGYCGLVSVAQAGFFGIGAYTAGLMSVHLHTNFLVGVATGTLLTAAICALIGSAILRLRGRYLIMATLGINEVINLIMFNARFTGGPNGLPGVAAPSLFGFVFSSPVALYYLNLVGLALVTAIVALLINSPVGRSIVAVREDDLAAEAIGINVASTKLLAFTLAGAIAGLAGGFYAHNTAFVSYQVFSTNESFTMLAMLVIGGMGTLPGPFLGVAVLMALPELLRSASLFRYLLYGLVLAVVAPMWPGGLASAHFPRKRAVAAGERTPSQQGGKTT
jgi:branched-chain amino acid transport system permease protein